jgi:anti-anti-sigma factor
MRVVNALQPDIDRNVCLSATLLIFTSQNSSKLLRHHFFLYDHVLLITLEGDLLGMSQEQELIPLVAHYVRFSVNHCIVDLSKVQHMNSTGLSFLIRILGTVSASEGKMVLIHPTDQVSKLFTITKLDRIFTVQSSRSEALHYLLASRPKEVENDRGNG